MVNLEELAEPKKGKAKSKWVRRKAASSLHSAPFAHDVSIGTHCKLLKNKASGSNSVVESQPSKLLVAGSIPVSRSMFF